MKKPALNALTVITFLLVPVLAVARSTCPSRPFAYGKGDITLGSLLLLSFAVLCFFVSTLSFIRAHNLWKAASARWKRETVSAYVCTILFALLIAFLMMFTGYRDHEYASDYEHYSILARHGIFPQAFLSGLIFVSPAFLFPIGIVLLMLGFSGLKYRRLSPKSYLVAAFSASALFTLGGAIPVFWVGAFWLGGGLALCYCPVNRRSFMKNILLTPLYDYRKSRLKRKLNI
jgi:hypothetical protein